MQRNKSRGEILYQYNSNTIIIVYIFQIDIFQMILLTMHLLISSGTLLARGNLDGIFGFCSYIEVVTTEELPCRVRYDCGDIPRTRWVSRLFHNLLALWVYKLIQRLLAQLSMMTSSNGNIFRVTGHLCGEFTGDDAEL